MAYLMPQQQGVPCVDASGLLGHMLCESVIHPVALYLQLFVWHQKHCFRLGHHISPSGPILAAVYCCMQALHALLVCGVLPAGGFWGG